MAGIGTRLKRLLDKRTFTGAIQAYIFGSIIALGPFLLSVFSLAALMVLSVPILESLDRQAFAAGVVYVFGGALVVTGSYQMVLTRFLSDKIYAGEYSTLIESLFPALATTSIACLLTGIPVVWGLELSLIFKVFLVTLYQSIACLFVVMGFVSSAHRYRASVYAFGIAAVVGTLSGVVLARLFGLEGLIAGYTLGQFSALFLLVDWLTRDFGFPKKWDWGFLRTMKVFPLLVGIGLLQNLGVWIDKFLFWGSDLGLSAYGLVTAPKYDSAMFLGFLTAQPAIVHFFVKLEAEFSQDFHRYFDEVFFKSSLKDIEEAAANLRTQVVRALGEVAKVQGVLTFLCAFLAEEILRAVNLPVSQIGIFRSAVIASFFLVVMLFTNVLLLYLDRQKDVLVSVLVLFLGNGALSWLSLQAGYQFYGFGFAAACLLAMVVSLYFLLLRLTTLEYGTFSRISVQGQKRASSGLLARKKGGYGRYNPIHETAQKPKGP